MITRSLKPLVKREPRTPEAWLAKAMDAATPAEREQHAKTGLEFTDEEIHVETRMLLERELYRAFLDQRQLRAARDVARRMTALGPLQDIAHHDAARVCFALGEVDEAVREQRLAVLAAPEDRRAFQTWSLATLEHFAGDVDAAMASLDRAERWATDDRPLIRAHRVYVELDSGRAVEHARIAELEEVLPRARRGGGYSQFLRGMISWHLGDTESARKELAAFVLRAESASPAKAITLREELRRARMALHAIT